MGAAGLAAAQETTGTFTGSVTDQTGAVLPGVSVTIRNVNTGFTATFTTTTSGTYAAPVLPVGTYDLEFSLSGFETLARRGVVLHVSDRLAVNATLNAGGVSEAIEVTAGGELIQQTSALQSLMGAKQVQELPLNNRNFVQLATLVPGVSSDLGDEVGIGLTSTVSVSINGARRNAVNWLVDGVSNVDVGSNITLLATPTVDSIEEFKILTSSYAAEWQRSGGGVVNLVTKSGTNQFKGSLYEYYRNDSLNENSFFRKQSSDPLISQNAPALNYHNFGWTLGGPIQKDKLFFFASQEWRRIKRAASPITNVPQPAWLTDPTNANYVAPADRDPNAVALLDAWPQPNNPAVPGQYVNSSPGVNNTRQEVVRARLQHQPELAGDGALHPRPQRDGRRGRRPVPRNHRARSQRRQHHHAGARQHLRGAAHRQPRPEHRERGLVPVLEQCHHLALDRRRPRPPRRLRPRHSGGFRGQRRRPHSVRADHRALHDRRQPGDRHQVPQPHVCRRPDGAARQPHLQDRRPGQLREQGRERRQPHPGRLHLRRRRRPHRVPEFPARQQRRPVRGGVLLFRGGDRHHQSPPLPALRRLCPGFVARDPEGHDRRGPALLRVSGGHRHERRDDLVCTVLVQRRERADVLEHSGHRDYRRHRRSPERHRDRRPQLRPAAAASTRPTRATCSRASA